MEFQPYEPFASNMWIISLLPDRLPGRVYEKWANRRRNVRYWG